jgi:hypothetical protein
MLLAAGCLAAALVSTAGTSAEVPVTVLPTPTAEGSGMYALAVGDDGGIYLTWIDPLPDKVHALRFSRLDGDRWSPPVEIARGSDWFVNWADHPSLTALADGSLLAHWLVHTGRRTGAYGYGIRVALSRDGGASWRQVFEDGMRNVSDYAGFLTFAPGADGADAVYLSPAVPDEGDTGAGHGSSHEPTKTLAAVRLGADGARGQQVVDGDVCSCCSTDVARTPDGLVAVYRDHEPGEIRDISILRLAGGRWSEPSPVHRDGWRIPGCPTNGPAVAVRGRRVAVTWFTAANDTPRVKLALSDDGGVSFGPPVAVDGGAPVGWPDVVLLDDGSALVSWLERRGEGRGDVMLRPVKRGHAPGPAVVVATSASGRATGMPQMVRSGERLIVAWRKDRVLTASVPVASVSP